MVATEYATLLEVLPLEKMNADKILLKATDKHNQNMGFVLHMTH